ncbi:MAG: two-component system, OmpR family, sensor kinase [Campylobacterota bacterium]|nr:two-component system, OmpR family, sensor kinase [Campylobacterota bacterium]
MSIFTKITSLFLISLTLMIGIGYQIEKINTQKYEALLLQKYLLDGRKIFTWMAVSSAEELAGKLKTLNLVTMDPQQPKRFIIRQPHTFGLFEIFEAPNGDYVMHIRYIDEDLYLRDTALGEAQKEEWMLSYLVLADIIVLAVIFFIIIRMLSPLHAIASSMRQFANKDYRSRSDVRSHDEIGEVARTYNEMAQTIENLIRSREALLRDIGHELRTPISRGLFALENIESSNAKEVIKRSLAQLDQLTQELLEIERFQATDTLNVQPFSAQTLVLEALSKLQLADESAIQIELKSNFSVTGDLKYLSLALKNLLDNALKYTDQLPITLEVTLNKINVYNHGEPLKKEFEHLLTPFTREEDSRTMQGFGLGLNIVSKIVNKHNFALEHAYEAGFHRFSIIM